MIDKIGWKFLKAAILLMTLMICSMPSLAQAPINLADVRYDQRDPNHSEDQSTLQKRIQFVIKEYGVNPDAKYLIIPRETTFKTSTADFNKLIEDSLRYFLNKSEEIINLAKQCQEISNNQLGSKWTDENHDIIQNVIKFLEENSNLLKKESINGRLASALNMVNPNIMERVNASIEIESNRVGNLSNKTNSIESFLYYTDENSKQENWGKFLSNLSKKDLDDITKDYSKGKINKKLKGPLNLISGEFRNNNRYEKIYEEVNGQYDVDPSKSESLFRSYWPKTYEMLLTEETVTVFDTVPNPIARKSAFLSGYGTKTIFGSLEGGYKQLVDEYDFALLLKGYEWIFTDKLQLVHKSYPENVAYLVSESHPEAYIVSTTSGDGKDWSVYRQKYQSLEYEHVFLFDENGKLKRVIDIDPQLSYNHIRRHYPPGIGKQVAVLAYQDNKYDIKSAGKEANDYITSQLNLREPTAAEKKILDKSADLFAEGFKKSMTADAKHGTNSKRAKAEKNEGDLLMMAALFGGSNVSDKGAGWLSQIEKDYWPYFEKFYKIERVDDVTIRVIYVDPKSIEPAFEIEYKYVTGDKPFTAKETRTIRKISK